MQEIVWKLDRQSQSWESAGKSYLIPGDDDRQALSRVFIAGGFYLCHYYVRPKRVRQQKGHRIQEKPAVAATGRLSRDTVAHLPVE